MRPSVSQLLSWQPGQLSSAGQSLLTRAGDLQRSAGDLTAIGAGLSGVWSGAAAQAATAHHARRSDEVDELATVVHSAGQALIRAADSIRPAKASLQSALAAAAAAGCSVSDDGTVTPPARPSMPAGLDEPAASAWQAQADATAAAQAATAARLQAQIQAALSSAGAADDASATAVAAVRPPRVSPPPRPVRMGLTGGEWGPIGPPASPRTPPSSTVGPAIAPAPTRGVDGGERPSWWREGVPWRDLPAPGPNDWLDLANGLVLPSVERAVRAEQRYQQATATSRRLEAARAATRQGSARRRANRRVNKAQAQVLAADRVRRSTANAFPAKYLPRTTLYRWNQPISRGLPVLGKVPILSLPLTAAGVGMDAQRMSTKKAVVKNVASTAAGLGVVAVGATVGAPVLAAVAVGAVVGYGVGLAVEHWGDDVADAATSAARTAGRAAGKAQDVVGDAADELGGKARDLWGRLRG